jgi:HK97 family phage major capsid protein
MAQGSTDSDSIKYPVETVTATGAAEVAEGSTKPEAQISFADTTEPVQTIAVLLPITTRSLQNQPFLRAYINSRLRLFVQMREDAQLLNGNGTSPNLKGILNRSGINTATSYSIGGSNPDQALVDAIFHASMRVQDAFLEPDAAVMKGSTWELAALAKDGNRNYLLGGPGAVRLRRQRPGQRGPRLGPARRDQREHAGAVGDEQGRARRGLRGLAMLVRRARSSSRSATRTRRSSPRTS